jgi:hypothetical protein
MTAGGLLRLFWSCLDIPAASRHARPEDPGIMKTRQLVLLAAVGMRLAATPSPAIPATFGPFVPAGGGQMPGSFTSIDLPGLPFTPGSISSKLLRIISGISETPPDSTPPAGEAIVISGLLSFDTEGPATFSKDRIETPEPAMLALVGSGLLALGFLRRRRKQNPLPAGRKSARALPARR